MSDAGAWLCTPSAALTSPSGTCAGKIAGKPVHALLGGAHRDRLPAYGTIYPIERTPEGVKQQVEAGKKLNLRAFKLVADPWWMDDLALTGRLLQAARQVAGPDAHLIVDAALSYQTADEGLHLLPVLKDAGIWFLEAPLPLDDVAGHARMAGQGIPLGVGDLGLTHVLEFIEMMDRGGADICQPDISQVGGFTGILKVAAAAAQRGKRVITHGYKTNIEIAANLHFLAAQKKEEILEFSLSHSPLRWKTTLEHFPVESDGCVRVPQAPGLGATLNPEILRFSWPAHKKQRLFMLSLCAGSPPTIFKVCFLFFCCCNAILRTCTGLLVLADCCFAGKYTTGKFGILGRL